MHKYTHQNKTCHVYVSKTIVSYSTSATETNELVSNSIQFGSYKKNCFIHILSNSDFVGIHFSWQLPRRFSRSLYRQCFPFPPYVVIGICPDTCRESYRDNSLDDSLEPPIQRVVERVLKLALRTIIYGNLTESVENFDT
jgi:hypothetical protein